VFYEDAFIARDVVLPPRAEAFVSLFFIVAVCVCVFGLEMVSVEPSVWPSSRQTPLGTILRSYSLRISDTRQTADDLPLRSHSVWRRETLLS